MAQLDIDGPAAPPRSNGELVFAEPWESRAFGLCMTLYEAGAFTWDEFRDQLVEAIATWERDAQPGDCYSYYRCWLTALERVVVAKDILTEDALTGRATELAARPAGYDHGHEHGDDDHDDHGDHGHGHGHGHGH